MSIWKGTILLVVSSLASRLLGLLRDRILTQHFGVHEELDIYLSAFKVPDFVFGIFIAGVLSAVFIPVYLKKEEDERGNFLNTILIGFLIIMGIGSLGIFFGATPLARIVSPGFSSEALVRLAELIRIMSVSILIFTISNVFSSVLNAVERYGAYALAPILYNIGIIVGFYFFVPVFGLPGLAYGVVLGALLHMCVQISPVLKTGWRPNIHINYLDFLQLLKKMIPRFLSGITLQFNIFVINYYLSFAIIGSITMFYLANNIYYVVIGTFIISISTTIFPRLVRAARDTSLGRVVTEAFNDTLFFTIPFTALSIISGAALIVVLYGEGGHIQETARTLAWLSLSLPFQGGVYILAKAFYALEDTIRPFIINCIMLILMIAIFQWVPVVGSSEWVALVYTSTIIIQYFLMLIVLFLKYKIALDLKRIVCNLAILIVNTGIAVCAWYVVKMIVPIGNVSQTMEALISLVYWIPAGVIFLYCSHLSGMKYVELVFLRFRK